MKKLILIVLLSTNYIEPLEKKELKLLPVKNKTGCLSSHFLQYINKLFHPDIFVETGTFLGQSAMKAAKIFKSVHTIELSQDLVNKAKEFLSTENNVTIHQGDSSEVLKELLPKLQGKILFWLDGHYSGLHAGHQTALSAFNPLLVELDNIRLSKITNAIIMIDDIRFCDPEITKVNDPIIGGYPNMDEICKKIYEINNNYRIVVMGDILFAYPNSTNIHPSKVLNACTYSRLYNDDANKNDHSILHFENIISSAQGIEKNAIEILSKTFGSDLYSMQYGVAKHYILWHGLILQKNRKFKKSLERFNKLKRIGFNHWRMDIYYNKLISYKKFF